METYISRLIINVYVYIGINSLSLLRNTLEIILSWILSRVNGFSSSTYDPMAGSFEHGDETPDSITDEKYTE
jgi:hypothetical protein